MPRGIYPRTEKHRHTPEWFARFRKPRPSCLVCKLPVKRPESKFCSISCRSRWGIPEEQRRKMSASRMGLNTWSKGRKHSIEARRKMSEAMKGKSTRWLKGRRLSDETRRKLSEIRRGVRLTSKGKLWRCPFYIDGRTYSPGYLNQAVRLRAERVKAAEGSHTIGEWENLKAQCNWICISCGKQEPAIKLEQDHIIPISRGGSNNIENIQPLCGPCNRRKYNKIIINQKEKCDLLGKFDDPRSRIAENT